MIQNRLKDPFLALSRRRALCAILSFSAICVSFFLIHLYEVNTYERSVKWEGDLYNGASIEGITLAPKYGGFSPYGLKRYTVKLDFKIIGYFFEIRFCDKYNFNLDLASPSKTGIYRIINIKEKVRISKFDYGSLAIYRKMRPIFSEDCPGYPHYRLNDVRVELKCDLDNNTAEVYLNDIFCEDLALEGGSLSYLVSLYDQVNTRVFLKKMRVSDDQGRTYYIADNTRIFPYKEVSLAIFVLGLAVLLWLFSANRGLFLRLAIIIAVLFFAECYLRLTEKHNPYLNIHVAKTDWDVENFTNLFGRYDNVRQIEIRNQWHRIYPIDKPKGTVRILCLGSSPVEGAGVNSEDVLFTTVLENKLNAGSKIKYEVINAGVTGYTLNGVKLAVYFSDALIKLSPDLVLVYDDYFSFNEAENADLQLYKRMRKIIGENSDWITDQRMLRMALEFKYPVKWLVLLYDKLCESYLFMSFEYLRNQLTKPHFSPEGSSSMEPDNEALNCSFEKILGLCKRKNIKILLVPQYNFIKHKNNASTLRIMSEIRDKNKNVYMLDMAEAFSQKRNSYLSSDFAHMSEYGHELLAYNIYSTLKTEGLISEREKMVVR